MIGLKKIFYGWIVVFSGAVLLALVLGMFSSTNSLFVKPVCEAFGFARGPFTLHRTIITLTGALVMPFYGRLIQKIGVKKVLLAGALMMGLVSIGYSFAARLWHFYLLALVYGLFLNGVSFMSVGVLINAWFDGKKGLATGLAYSGSGLGGVIMIPVVASMIERFGWQWAYRFMGLFGIAVLLPVIAVFVKNKPEDSGLAPLASKPSPASARPAKASTTFDSSPVNISFREALHTLKFWFLVIACFFINFFASPTNTHSAPYLSDLGYSTAFVSSVISLYMIFLTVGKLILGSVYDRFGAMVGNILISVFCLGFPIFAYISWIPAMPWVYAVFIGMASCAVSVPIPFLINRYFGSKDFPTILSFCMMVSNLAPSISVPAMGAVYDLTGNYRPAWIVFFFCSIIIVACLIAVEIIHKQHQKQA